MNTSSNVIPKILQVKHTYTVRNGSSSQNQIYLLKPQVGQGSTYSTVGSLHVTTYPGAVES